MLGCQSIRQLPILMIGLLIGQSDLIYAENLPDFTLNGLLEGKAIFVVNGKPLMLSAGQQKQGITLVDANMERAIVEVDGKRRTMVMDKMLDEEAPGFHLPGDGQGNTHIIAAQLAGLKNDQATFDIDYYYDGKAPGAYVTLIAKTYFEGKPTGCSEHSYARLEPGRHVVRVIIAMSDKAPDAYLSDKLWFEMRWSSEKSSGILASKIIEFIKHWERGS